MQCNIDRKGQISRLIWAIICLIGAGVLALLAYTGTLTGPWPYPLAGGAFAFSLLGFFSAKNKWCIMRAMGFKTPL